MTNLPPPSIEPAYVTRGITVTSRQFGVFLTFCIALIIFGVYTVFFAPHTHSQDSDAPFCFKGWIKANDFKDSQISLCMEKEDVQRIYYIMQGIE